MGNQDLDEKGLKGRSGLGMVWVPLQAGCLTFAVAGAAILIGLWLDVRLGTTPRWTLTLLIGSAPFALGGVFLIVRRALRKMRAAQEVTETPSEEEL